MKKGIRVAPCYTYNQTWHRARVKHYNEIKGFGFLILENTREEVYMSGKTISDVGLESLVKGDLVEVQIKEGDTGLRASRIRLLEAN